MKISLTVRSGLCGFIAVCVTGCAGKLDPIASSGTAFADLRSPGSGQGVPGGYRLGPLDTLSVRIFNEPDLKIEEQAIDQSGQFSMPLVGNVRAAGRTTAELQADITARLNARYLRNAQVSVAVVKPINYSFTVSGEVQKPGVYQIPGRITLSQAVALGEGLTHDARLDDTVVVRQIEGKQYAARFNLSDIRTGLFPDPEIKQGDTVIVGLSKSSRLASELIAVLPSAAGIFIALSNRF